MANATRNITMDDHTQIVRSKVTLKDDGNLPRNDAEWDKIFDDMNRSTRRYYKNRERLYGKRYTK